MNTPEIVRAAALLRAGEIVAFPTDTVYGVGAVAHDEAAVRRLYVAKLRPAEKAMPVLLADPADLALVARDLSTDALRIASKLWPGPLTLVVRAVRTMPRAVTAGGDTIAVRVPDHELARSLIRAVGCPLATSSANRSGQPSSLTVRDVAAHLGDRVAMILDGGPCPGGMASTILDLTGDEPAILRAGPIDLQQIVAVMR